MLSLLFITVVTLIAPVISFEIPHKIVPEVFLLLVGGMILGPYGLGLAQVTEPIHLLSELGLGFLFLLAGYEIEPSKISGKVGLGAITAWSVSLITAFGVMKLYSQNAEIGRLEGIAIAIAMSATALGTLLPILRDRKVMDTPTGKAVLAHGAIGEIGPIVAMALLLSVSSTWHSFLILIVFITVSLLITRLQKKAQELGSRFIEMINFGSDTTAQTTVRIVTVLLVGLIAFASLLGLDIVLGAFAAGFIVRQALPDGRAELEEKLDGLAFGFFIPVFFVVSGMSVDFTALFTNPTYLLIFLISMLAARGVPVMLTLRTNWAAPAKNQLSWKQSAMSGLYCTTNLPIIVAVTQIAVNAEAMSPKSASILVMAGSISVLLMPLMALLVDHLPTKHAPNQKPKKQQKKNPPTKI